MKSLAALGALAALLVLPLHAAHAGPIAVVAAENFYGDVAQQIGGAEVKVTSILNNPDQDPHLFEVSPSVARAVASARIVVISGIGYDPWMEKLVAAGTAPDRKTIVVADLIGHKPGDNPHIWYDPPTMPAFAKAFADTLAAVDAAHASDFQARLRHFQQSLRPMQSRVAALRARLAGTPATATEPVFNDMFAALGMQVRNMGFQIAVMNSTEPSAAGVAAFENDLRTRRVRLLVYNSQASDPIAERMEELARASGIPVVGASETEPPGKTYQAWMLGMLDAVDQALPK